MRDVSAAEIEASLDGKMSSIFDLLGNEFSEDDLLGEILASDDDTWAMGARGEGCEEGHQRNGREGTAFSRADYQSEKLNGTIKNRALPL